MGCVGALFPGLSGSLGMERVLGLSFLRIISFKSKNCLWWSSAVLAKSRSPLGKKRTARYLTFVNYICDITEREREREGIGQLLLFGLGTSGIIRLCSIPPLSALVGWTVLVVIRVYRITISV